LTGEDINGGDSKDNKVINELLRFRTGIPIIDACMK